LGSLSVMITKEMELDMNVCFTDYAGYELRAGFVLLSDEDEMAGRVHEWMRGNEAFHRWQEEGGWVELDEKEWTALGELL